MSIFKDFFMNYGRYITFTLLLFLSQAMAAMTLTSSAFTNNGQIPERYTCRAQDVSPPLQWSDVPSTTQSLALVVTDVDAPSGVWDHWLLFNLSKNLSGLPENLQKLPEEAKVGLNSWGKLQYNGPCPPSGTHHYVFRLYALNTKLNLPPKVKRVEFEAALKGHILATADLIGLTKAEM